MVTQGGKQSKADTKQHILDAAAVLFHEHGYDGASMTQLAKKVGVKPASIYYHFPSKRDILFEILKGTGANLVEACKSAVTKAADSATERLRAFVKTHILIELDMLELMPLVDTHVFRATNLSNALDKEQRDHLVKGQREILDLLREILTEGKENGSLDFDDITVAIFAILGPIEHVVYWFQRDGDLTPEEVADKLAEMAVRSVRPVKCV